MAEFPKVSVRVIRTDAGLAAELRLVADAEAEAAALAEGFVVVVVPPAVFHAFPKMLYHTEGARQIVATRDDQDALGADWHETSVPPPEVEPPAEEPPPA